MLYKESENFHSENEVNKTQDLFTFNVLFIVQSEIETEKINMIVLILKLIFFAFITWKSCCFAYFKCNFLI